METRIKLDVGSISVSSFDTRHEEKGGNAHLALVTRSTINICCVDTMCVTKAECSTETCTA